MISVYLLPFSYFCMIHCSTIVMLWNHLQCMECIPVLRNNNLINELVMYMKNPHRFLYKHIYVKLNEPPVEVNYFPSLSTA